MPESTEGISEYELLTGNQTGMLLLDYICSQRVKHGKMPADPVMVKTIVTMDMGEQIATHYGLRTINVLTGFKFIGEQIGKLEEQGKADSYVFGFEESYGYLTGSYVRDKDGVDGAYMICEMFSYYATKGISLLDKLDELYKTYGYCLNTLHSYEFDGSAGFAKMQSIMQAFRGDIKEFGGKKVVKLLDYASGLDGLPKRLYLKCPVRSIRLQLRSRSCKYGPHRTSSNQFSPARAGCCRACAAACPCRTALHTAVCAFPREWRFP
ncbi:hypothetical protein [Gemmiger sp.]